MKNEITDFNMKTIPNGSPDGSQKDATSQIIAGYATYKINEIISRLQFLNDVGLPTTPFLQSEQNPRPQNYPADLCSLPKIRL